METPFLPIDAFKAIKPRIGLKNEAISFKRNWITQDKIQNYTYSTKNLSPGVSVTTFDYNDPDLLVPVKIDFSNNQNGYIYDFDVELKLIVDIEYNSIDNLGFPNKSTQILTYKIDPNNILHLDGGIDLYTPIGNFTSNKENLSLVNVNFGGQAIEGCTISNGVYTCKSWNNITIGGDLTTSNGYKVNIIAGNEIYEINNSSVSPEITLSIEPVLDYSQPMPKADQNYVTSFCKGSNGLNSPSYQARYASKKMQAAIDKVEAKNNSKIQQNHDDFSWDFEMYPNPTNSTTNLQFKGNFDEQLEIHVIDITGKEVYSATVKNEEHSTIDVSQLNKGIYFLGVISKGVTKTKQLIIQ